jgi:hypothetical protein
MYRSHAFKTAFSTIFGQLCYLRMGQGLSRASHTYARVKDITLGRVPGPNSEDVISGISEGVLLFLKTFLMILVVMMILQRNISYMKNIF